MSDSSTIAFSVTLGALSISLSVSLAVGFAADRIIAAIKALTPPERKPE